MRNFQPVAVFVVLLSVLLFFFCFPAIFLLSAFFFYYSLFIFSAWCSCCLFFLLCILKNEKMSTYCFDTHHFSVNRVHDKTKRRDETTCGVDFQFCF